MPLIMYLKECFMDIKEVEAQHKEGLAKLAVALTQKDNTEKQIESLRNQLLQLEAVMQFSASSQPKSTEPVAAPGEGEE